jgi:hypothetical protein
MSIILDLNRIRAQNRRHFLMRFAQNVCCFELQVTNLAEKAGEIVTSPA